MYIRLLMLLSLILLLLGVPAFAQDDGKPAVAILRYRNTTGFQLAGKAFLDMMEAYGFISEEERAVLDAGEELDGERINVFWGDAGGDLPTANLLVEQALDRGATILVTQSTPVTQIAVGLTNDMEKPVPVVFSIVGAPYSAGIARASCIKPDHVAGTKVQIPRDQIVALVAVQDPDADTIGVLVNAAEANSVNNANLIERHGEALGFAVERMPIASAADLPVAVGTLVDKEVDALFITGYTDSAGLPAILGPALEAGVPVIGLSPVLAMRGATIGAGFNGAYVEGVVAARMIANYLNGDVDLSTIAINEIPQLTIALNLDSAAERGFEFSEEMLARADFVIQNGESTEDTTPPALPDISFDELRAADLEFLASLECTPAMIAEQQAALDATSE